MINIEYIKIYNIEAAVRGMRNPMNSWDKSDSYVEDNIFHIGKNDLKLMKQLYNAGTEHRKYLRQIMVSMDITAPLYWWKQFDTYKIGTVANSCSTMHKLTEKSFEISDFSFDKFMIKDIDQTYVHSDIYFPNMEYFVNDLIENLNILRNEYIKTKDTDLWNLIVELLPESYNQKRTITMNYENAITMIKQRKNHKLQEWHDLCDEFINELPLIDFLINDKEYKIYHIVL